MVYLEDKITLAYVIGLALGDGNLSTSNGRTVKLRITCDLKYPELIQEIMFAIKVISPKNNVGIATRPGNCIDIYSYNIDWPSVLGWNIGSKASQNVHVPEWIKENREYTKACLKGLIQTDGSIYVDRGYKMVNFTSCIENLAKDAIDMIKSLGFKPTVAVIRIEGRLTRYTIRISKNVQTFIDILNLKKE